VLSTEVQSKLNKTATNSSSDEKNAEKDTQVGKWVKVNFSLKSFDGVERSFKQQIY